MSVFVALIFQVLFVFFAMVVNIGMVVHNKINLQNSVDLGAYYAAQRQAEILNEIAHLNYQIRQDFKLLTWRYRVLGTTGRTGRSGNFPPPIYSSGQLPDVRWQSESDRNSGIEEEPSVCIASRLWSDFQETDDPTEQNESCRRDFGTNLTNIPSIPIFLAIIPGIVAAQASAALAQSKLRAVCTDMGPMNWTFTMNILLAYKLSIASKKIMIERLRKNLVSNDMRDLNGESVRDGVLKTIVRNLTAANAADFDDQYFEVMNGLNNPRCAGPNLDGAPTLPEVAIAPLILFTRFAGTTSCTPSIGFHDSPPTTDDVKFDTTQVLRQFAGEPNPSDRDMNILRSSLGYEKNPWCMAYMGVRAQTRPSSPFAPMGGRTEMMARSFAQPFGGRIGPWYRDSWPSSESRSIGMKTDALVPTRFKDDLQGLEDQDGKLRIPNFSRYPGDLLGLKSTVAMGAQRQLIGPIAQRPFAQRLKLAYYSTFDSIPFTGDPLAWDSDTNQIQPGTVPAMLRFAEISAVAPDLFDATYYSIDPAYNLNYRTLYDRNPDRFGGALPKLLGAKVEVPYDIGGRLQQGFPQFNVEAQIQTAVGASAGSGSSLDSSLLSSGAIYWAIRDWRHLLTSWSPYGVQDFITFPEDRFGKCAATAAPENMIPGKCVKGGRIGYSIRTVSREHLMGADWMVGGRGQGAGSIWNPPLNTW